MRSYTIGHRQAEKTRQVDQICDTIISICTVNKYGYYKFILEKERPFGE